MCEHGNETLNCTKRVEYFDDFLKKDFIYAISELKLFTLPNGMASETVYGAKWTEYFSQTTYTDIWVLSVTPYIKKKSHP
jgi:hypothetical protein